MAATDPSEISEVLDRIRAWSPSMRIVLARKVLETLETPAVSKPLRTMDLNSVMGLLSTESLPPDDTECERIVEQERVRKNQ